MSRITLFFRLAICILAVGSLLFSYIEKQNELTELRLSIPLLKKKLKKLQQENIRLMYEIEKFENPVHLMELVQQPEYSHLKYPYLNEQIFLRKPDPFTHR